MSTQSKQLLNAVATAAFAIAAAATTVTSAYAQTSAPAGKPASSSADATATASGALGAAAGKQQTPLTREQVQAAYLEARKNGTLIETESDLDVAQTRKHFAK